MNLRKICRLCLSSGRAMYPLFGDNQIRRKSSGVAIVDVLNMFGISIAADYAHPSEICITCLNTLNSAYDFKLKCEKLQFPVTFSKQSLAGKANGICRICLKIDEPMLSIYGVLFHLRDTMYETVPIAELLRLFYGIKINNKGISNYICVTCIEEVKQIFAFKLKYEKMKKKYSNSLYSILLQAQNRIKIQAIIPTMSELGLIEIKEEIFDDYNPNIQFESIIIKKEVEINFTDNNTSSKATNNILDCGIAILDNLPAKASDISDPLFVLDAKSLDAEIMESITFEMGEIIEKTLTSAEIMDDAAKIEKTTGNETIVETPKIKTVKKQRNRCPIAQVRIKRLTISPKVEIAKATTEQYETSEGCKKYSIKCPLCFIIVPTIDLLGNHIKTKHTDGTSCELCYEKNIIWPDHINVHYCKICLLTFCGKTAVAMHKKAHKMSKFRCTVCRRNCRSQENLNRHIKLRHRAFQYKCKLCSFSARSNVRLARHMKTGHYSCRDCPKIFDSRSELRHHEFEHTGQSSYQCEICSLVCNSRRHLIEHKKFHTEIPTLFECKVCKKQFKTEAERQAHVKEHIEKIGKLCTHKCETCSKEFTKRSEAEIHKRMHTLTFKCDICPSTFQRKRFLSLHMKTHRRNRIFPSTLTRSNRKVLVKNYQAVIKHYDCKKCGRKFLRELLLKEHLESHKVIKKDRNRKCTHCSGVFKSQHGLHIHLAKAHGTKY